MPITKVPLVHKFGIVSLSEAERIIRQQRLQDHNSKRKSYINKYDWISGYIYIFELACFISDQCGSVMIVTKFET